MNSGRVFKDAHPGGPQLIIVGAADGPEPGVLVFLGNEQALIDAPAGRKFQRGEHDVVRDKVSGGDPDPGVGAVKQTDDGLAEGFVAPVWSAQDNVGGRKSGSHRNGKNRPDRKFFQP